MQCQHAALAEGKNRVEALEMMTLLIALLGAVSGVLAVVNQRRTAKETHQVAEAAHIIAAYDQLCAMLRSEIKVRDDDIERLRCRVLELEGARKELSVLRVRVAEIEQRETGWDKEKAQLLMRLQKLEREREQEKAELTARIQKLERERAHLEAQLEDLREHTCGGKR